MMTDMETIQNYGKGNVDAAMKSFGAASKGVQAMAVEVADYTKKSFEQGASAVEKLFGVRSLDKAMEVQADYAKSAYEGLVAQATKLGELYVELAKESYKPFETIVAKASVAK